MVFLDTGELPWGMDLFDGQADRQVQVDCVPCTLYPTLCTL